MSSPFDVVKAFRDETDATRDNLFAGLRNQDPTTITSGDVLAATTAATATQTSVAATAARLDATLTRVTQGGGGGADDQFERIGADLGPDWAVVDSGTGGVLQTDGHNAIWVQSGSSANWVVAKRDTVTTSTDNQLSRIVLAEPLNTISGWLLILRMNTAQDTYVYGLIKRDYLEIGYVTSGTPTVLESSTDPFDPSPATRIDFFCDGDDFVLGGGPGSLTANSAAPSIGAGYRNTGFGADVQPDSGAQVPPGQLELWAGFDHSAPPVAGVYFEARPSTNVTPTGPFVFPNNTFDDVMYQSDWLTYNAGSNNTLVVQLPGAYLVEVLWVMDTTMPSGDTVFLLAGISNFSAVFSGVFIDRVQFSTVVYRTAGEEIIPGFVWTGTPNDVTTSSSFKVTKLSPPYFA